MSNSPIWQVQQALYEVLSIDASLSAIVNGVYSNVPQNQDFPYVQIGSFEANEITQKAREVVKITYDIIAFSQRNSLEEILNITSVVKNILNEPNFTMNDYNLIRIDHIKSDIDSLSDGMTWISKISFEIVVQEKIL